MAALQISAMLICGKSQINYQHYYQILIQLTYGVAVSPKESVFAVICHLSDLYCPNVELKTQLCSNQIKLYW